MLFRSKAIWHVKNVDMSSNVFGDFGYFPFFAGAVSGSILFFGLCSRFKSGSVLTSLSTGTLVVLGLHWPVFRFVGPIVRRLHLPGSLLPALLITIPTLAVCLLAIVFSKRHCPALLGKPHSTRGERESIESKESVPH